MVSTSAYPMAPLPVVPGVTHRDVVVDGLRLHVAEAGVGRGPGEAPTLVLVHGWPQHWYEWRRVVPLLAPHYHLVMPDLRGHGWSEAPPGGYDKEQLATDLLGLLDVLSLDRVGLVGHDWGGWTSFLAALRAPERFSGLLALGITHPFRHRSGNPLQAWRMAYQLALATPVLAQAALRSVPRLVETLITAGSSRPEVFSREDLRAYSAVLADPARAHASSLLYRSFVLGEGLAVERGRYDKARLRVPTRLVVGDGDPVITAGLLPGAEGHAEDLAVEVLTGVGHFVPEEAPADVARHVHELFPT